MDQARSEQGSVRRRSELAQDEHIYNRTHVSGKELQRKVSQGQKNQSLNVLLRVQF